MSKNFLLGTSVYWFKLLSKVEGCLLIKILRIMVLIFIMILALPGISIANIYYPNPKLAKFEVFENVEGFEFYDETWGYIRPLWMGETDENVEILGLLEI